MGQVRFHQPSKQEIAVLHALCSIGMLDERDAKNMLVNRLEDLQARLYANETPEHIASIYTLQMLNGEQHEQHAAILKVLAQRPGKLADHVRNFGLNDLEQLVTQGVIPAGEQQEII